MINDYDYPRSGKFINLLKCVCHASLSFIDPLECQPRHTMKVSSFLSTSHALLCTPLSIVNTTTQHFDSCNVYILLINDELLYALVK